MSRSATIYSVQYLRGFAALLVLLHHLATKSEQVGRGLFPQLHFGVTGVDIFFIISGFIMCHIYMASATGKAALVDFWQRRVVRILPLYWALTLLALCVFLVTPSNVNSSGGTTSVWKSFFLIPGKDKFLIENGWTLSFEFYFYAIFSSAFFFANKRRGAHFVAFIILLCSACSIFGLLRVPFLTNPIILEFAFGILVCLLYRRSNVPRTICGTAAVIGAIGLSLYHQPIQLLPVARHLAAGIPAAFFVLGIVCSEARLPHSKLSLLAKLGDSSYSMYLFHPFVLAVAGIVFRRMDMIVLSATFEVAYWALVCAMTLFISHYVYLYIEKPLIRQSRKMILRKPRLC